AVRPGAARNRRRASRPPRSLRKGTRRSLRALSPPGPLREDAHRFLDGNVRVLGVEDRKSTRLNSSHRTISYAVFCLKKKKMILTTLISHQDTVPIYTAKVTKVWFDKHQINTMQ